MQFTIRPWSFDDLDSLVRHGNNLNVSQNMSDYFVYPYTRESAETYLARATKDDPTRSFAIVIEGEAAGGIGVHPQTDIHCKNAELGFWLSEMYWGRGIITAAIPQMLDYGFRTHDITRIYATVFGRNKASQRVLEKTGFVLEARIDQILFKNGAFEDQLIYAVRRPKG